ncbi:MAG: hypothetical protein GY927_24185 [bacterium]|nr:hypothetical protein [bacterium]
MPSIILHARHHVSRFLSVFVISIGMLGVQASFVHAERLLIGGTGSSLGGMKLIATAFMKEFPEHQIVVLPSLGSAGGIRALTDGKIDLALSGRPLKSKENGRKLAAVKYAETPFIIATRRDNTTSRITSDELIKLYIGKTMRWKNGLPVRIVRRPPSEGDNKILKILSKEMKYAIEHVVNNSQLPLAFNDQENADALERLPGSLGALTLAQLQSERRALKDLMLNGVKGTLKNLKNGQYPFKKSLYFVTSQTPTPVVQAFLDFAFSKSGRNILEKHGHWFVTHGRS